MARLRRNEWNFASNVARLITEELAKPEFANSPLGRAEAELTELRGARRLDLVLFARSSPEEPLVTGETKTPWAADGRTPYNTNVVQDAHAKASACGARFFVTWNIKRAVVWRTDDPGVELLQRVVYDDLIVPQTISTQADLNRADVSSSLREGIHRFLVHLTSLLVGPPAPAYLPLDQLFVARLESLLDFPIERTANAVTSVFQGRPAEKARIEAWMREKQGWTTSTQLQRENIDRAARFTCYVLVNRLCFYNALRRKYTGLPRLAVANNITTGAQLQSRLARAFSDAERFTGDYDTVFEGDEGDALPFLSDEAVPEWRSLIRSLDHYDFASIDLDVISRMYERLIDPEERHKYGQHYTRPSVVDIINSFAIRDGLDRVLDPSCGGGTFLVRSYVRKRTIDPRLDHVQLLETVYGCDILHYACHLSVINLAVRDLIDDDNFPRVHCGDFLRLAPGDVFSELPIRMQSGGLPTGQQRVPIERRMFNSVVGNPPYIQSREIPTADRQAYWRLAEQEWPNFQWARDSDISVWFWTHSAQFLAAGGYLSLLTQAAWLDVEYGFPLQHWMLTNFQVVAVLETEAETWFSDARVATTVTVLKHEPDEALRAANAVRFVQFRRPLDQIIGPVTSEADRQRANERLRDRILGHDFDDASGDYRIRLVRQSVLASKGFRNEEYHGSKWGRYLRAIDVLYELQRDHPDQFCSLEVLASVQRGVTTNCDDFFIVTDVSADALEKTTSSSAFRVLYGVNRASVLDLNQASSLRLAV